MGVYRCVICEEYKDADFDGHNVHPIDGDEFCDNCNLENAFLNQVKIENGV